MSQNDFNIANQGFPSFRSDLNSALQALASLSSGDTAPTTTYANQLWYETDTNTLYIRDEANSAWLALMVIDQATGSPSFTAGNVGIGTSSPLAELHVNSGAANLAGLFESTDTGASIALIDNATTGGSVAEHGLNTVGDELEIRAVETLTFETAAEERMVINATGVGIGTAPETKLHVVRDLPTANSGAVVIFDRTTSNGEVVRFRKDGSTVGLIGVGSSIFIGSGDTTLTFAPSGDAIVPTGTDGATRSGAIDLGNSGNRWDTVFATVGTINTSDRTEKQDIEELNEAERRVAVACKGLLRKYRLKSAIALKGEDARIHFGIIAQDLQDAFAAEGLDAGRYGMFINSTWTDEETGEEKSLMGVRYSELLAFIIAAM